MANLILHIGGARTGSTSIQAALAGSRPLLAQNGVLYPQSGTHHEAHHLMAVAISGSSEQGIDHVPPFLPLLEQLKIEIQSSGCETVVLSSDLFQKLCNFHGQPALEAHMKQFLDLFRQVKVVCLVRHQVPFLESWYRFLVWWEQSSETKDFPEYVHAYMEEPFIEYQNISRFYTAFRPDLEFEFLSFFEASRSGKLVKDFYDRVGLSGCYPGEVRTNESLSLTGTQALLLRNRGWIPTEGFDYYHFMTWAKGTFSERAESLYDATLLRAVATRFAEGNAELAQQTGFNLEDELVAFETKQVLRGSELSEDFLSMVLGFTRHNTELLHLKYEISRLNGEISSLQGEFLGQMTYLKAELHRLKTDTIWKRVKRRLGTQDTP